MNSVHVYIQSIDNGQRTLSHCTQDDGSILPRDRLAICETHERVNTHNPDSDVSTAPHESPRQRCKLSSIQEEDWKNSSDRKVLSGIVLSLTDFQFLISIYFCEHIYSIFLKPFLFLKKLSYRFLENEFSSSVSFHTDSVLFYQNTKQKNILFFAMPMSHVLISSWYIWTL